MGFTKKPLKWSANGVEPSEDKKTQGFANGEYPAAGHFDFKFNGDYEAITELQQKAVESVNGVKPVNGDVAIEIPKPDLTAYETTVSVDKKLDKKVDKVDGKGLSTNDYSDAEKKRVSDLETSSATHKADVSHVHWLGSATGTNALTINYPSITALAEGLGVAFKCSANSTGATSLQINGLPTIPILKANGGAVNNLKANGIYTLRYSGTSFIVQGEGGEYGNVTASDVLAGKTFGTENGIVTGVATIASLGGGRVASGEVVGNTSVAFEWGNSAGSTNLFVVSVRNIGFTPKTIILTYEKHSTIYHENGFYNKKEVICLISKGAGYDLAYNLKGDKLTAFVDSTGFDLPVTLGGGVFKWKAYE